MFSWLEWINCATLLQVYALCLIMKWRLSWFILTFLKTHSFLANHNDHSNEARHTKPPACLDLSLNCCNIRSRLKVCCTLICISIQSVKKSQDLWATGHSQNKWVRSSREALHLVHSVFSWKPLSFKKPAVGKIPWAHRHRKSLIFCGTFMPHINLHGPILVICVLLMVSYACLVLKAPFILPHCRISSPFTREILLIRTAVQLLHPIPSL